MVVSELGVALTVSDGGVELCVLYVVVCVLGGVFTASEGAEEA